MDTDVQCVPEFDTADSDTHTYTHTRGHTHTTPPSVPSPPLLTPQPGPEGGGSRGRGRTSLRRKDKGPGAARPTKPTLPAVRTELPLYYPTLPPVGKERKNGLLGFSSLGTTFLGFIGAETVPRGYGREPDRGRWGRGATVVSGNRRVKRITGIRPIRSIQSGFRPTTSVLHTSLSSVDSFGPTRSPSYSHTCTFLNSFGTEDPKTTP